jgi:hypothetical protein
MFERIIEGVLFGMMFFGLIGATAFIEPIEQTVIEARGE